MALSNKVKNLIWGQFAGRCAICKEQVIHKNDSGDKSLYGEVAHIIGEKKGSARFSNKVDLDYRNSEENLLLLCANHHTIIDKKEKENDYNVEKLHNIKNKYLQWLEKNLNKTTKYNINLNHLFYLNIPRLNKISLKYGYGYRINLQKYNQRKNLHGHGWDLNYIMEECLDLFKHLKIDALNFDKISYMHQGYIGNLVYFKRIRFRIKNINMIENQKLLDYKFTGNLKEDPHIYFTHHSGWKLVLYTNKNWVTTSTAFSYFRPSGGSSIFSGFFRVTNIDYNKNIIFGSPFAIGLTPNKWDYILNENYNNKESNNLKTTEE